LKLGDVRGAQQKANELPPGAPGRGTPEYKAIQAAYADHLFDLAEKASHPADKRAFYDEIARTTSIDTARRQRANERLNALGMEEAVSITDLPKAVVRPPAASASQSAVRRSPTTLPDFSEPGDEAKPRTSPPEKQERPAVKQKAPAEPTTLVRENPFDKP
jgi:hypothetical protein